MDGKQRPVACEAKRDLRAISGGYMVQGRMVPFGGQVRVTHNCAVVHRNAEEAAEGGGEDHGRGPELVSGRTAERLKVGARQQFGDRA